METDVLIVGGGPAGLSAAIAAAQKGLHVTVVDQRKPPLDKACGEGLLPESVEALRLLGLPLDGARGYRFSAIRFADERSSCEAAFSGIAFGVRRTVLHALLCETAEAAGAQLCWGVRTALMDSSHAQIDGRLISFRWLVGADGLNSRVRTRAGLNLGRKVQRRLAFRRHYAVEPWSNAVEVHWGNGCEIIVTPTGAEEVCLALFTPDQHLRIDDALSRFPELRRRLRYAHPTSSEIGAVTALTTGGVVVRENIALIGDASGSVDGIAGQGLNLAFRQALSFGRAVEHGDLAEYAQAHRKITETAQRMTRLLLLMSRFRWIRRKTLRMFAAKPEFFSRMISIHAGAQQTQPLGLQELWGLGWQVLLA